MPDCIRDQNFQERNAKGVLKAASVLMLLMVLQGGDYGCVSARLHGVQSQRLCDASFCGAGQWCKEEQAPMTPLEQHTHKMQASSMHGAAAVLNEGLERQVLEDITIEAYQLEKG